MTYLTRTELFGLLLSQFKSLDFPSLWSVLTEHFIIFWESTMYVKVTLTFVTCTLL